ncbi:mannosyl-3-phosphoglycerate phosphatase [Rhodococcus gordoniae]|uniref:Mannosyl-3-phosphoglycerate phosphatase n=1 Tax=Rhodococcus gordoniae TaxID=223392 RepID=A0A379M2C3_9NOCA|nr:mannosyl-3-phosphoglycerate phosphatase [Rhodococcus gordoniae]
MNTPVPALVATDLDRTLIYSRAAMTGDQFATQDLLCVEYYEGAPLSYVTDGAARQLRALADEAAVVPTTTRTPEQFRRIDLPGGPWRYAIASNGGSILEDGHLDPLWRRTVESAVREGGASLDEITTELRSRISEDWVSKFRIADELFCYLVVDVAAQPAGFLDDWHDWCSARGWNASQQGRKIYTMPNSVCKSRAVAEVRRRLRDRGVLTDDAPVLAAGDGALDAEMLKAADAAIRPRHGELELMDWCHPTVSVTGAAGVTAGEEILAWFARSARLPAAS